MKNELKGNIAIVTKLSSIKTVAVSISDSVMHPKYKKRYMRTRRFLVHNEHPDVHVGDEVLIVPVRPISKQKSWAIEKITHHAIQPTVVPNEEVV